MEGGDFSGAAEGPGAWGRCPESCLASSHSPFYPTCAHFPCLLFNEDLVKTLQRGGKNFFVFKGAVWLGMKVDRLIERQNAFLGYFSQTGNLRTERDFRVHLVGTLSQPRNLLLHSGQVFAQICKHTTQKKISQTFIS